MRCVERFLLVILGPILGVGAGTIWASLAMEAEIAQIGGDDPDSYVCGLIALPYLAAGAVGGMLGGACGIGLASLLKPGERNERGGVERT